jgi:hypothetical protein
MRLVAVGLLVLIPSLASAQAPAPTSFSKVGVVEKITPTSIVIRDDADKDFSYDISAKVLVLRNKPITLSEIRPNDFVASAAMRGPDGKLHSTELRVFPDALRGLGEGQRPMNDPRNQTMTNATVTGTAEMNGSNDIKVKFAGGESELVLDPGVPVTRIEQINLTAIEPGLKVRIQGASANEANRITIQ